MRANLVVLRGAREGVREHKKRARGCGGGGLSYAKIRGCSRDEGGREGKKRPRRPVARGAGGGGGGNTNSMS